MQCVAQEEKGEKRQCVRLAGDGLPVATGMTYGQPMNKCTLPIALVATLFWCGPVGAGEIATQLETSTQDGVKSSNVSFEDPSCGGECQIATLSCNADANITIVLADIDAKDVAAAITAEEKQVMLKADGKSFEYFISDMQYAEMTRSEERRVGKECA